MSDQWETQICPHTALTWIKGTEKPVCWICQEDKNLNLGVPGWLPDVILDGPEIKQAVQRLYYWQHSRTECFSNLLYDLIQKADPQNRHRLAKGFSAECAAFDMWQSSANNGDDLFVKYGVGRKPT